MVSLAILPACVGLEPSCLKVAKPAESPEPFNTTKYLVPLVKVILLAPENVKVLRVAVVLAIAVALKLSEVASAEPVGFPVEPNVPVWAYIMAFKVPAKLAEPAI